MSDVNHFEVVPWDIIDAQSYGPLVMCVESHQRPPTKGVMLSEFVKGGHDFAHEVFGLRDQWLKPYCDYESYWETKEEMEKNKWAEYEACLEKYKAVFSKDVLIQGCESCGFKADKINGSTASTLL